jgi:NAD(P)-dependent dehydrogenase (short-subunit alcohol dehydrogenase family)
MVTLDDWKNGLGYRMMLPEGTWLVSKEVVKLMKEQKKGASIINMTSIRASPPPNCWVLILPASR